MLIFFFTSFFPVIDGTEGNMEKENFVGKKTKTFTQSILESLRKLYEKLIISRKISDKDRFSNILLLNHSFISFTEKKSLKEKLSIFQDYVLPLVKRLRTLFF